MNVPAGWHATTSPEMHMAGAKVLIVQDASPWGTSANQEVLNGMGVAYDMISSSVLAGTNLSGYRLVVVPSDQTTNFYNTLNAQRAKLEAFVNAGGVLEVHAAGWGWQGGDASLMTLPGGMRIMQYYSSSNRVLAPGHPLVVGVPNPFSGSSASHAYFTQVPVGATAVASDDVGRTNLVVYPMGSGVVVASCQTLEYGYVFGEAAGTILRNMLPFSYRPGPAWLAANPTSGRLAPGESVLLTVTFNATGLIGGDYAGLVNVRSNDPDEPEVGVAATMHVTGAPDLRVTGSRDSVESTALFNTPVAITTHHLAVPPPLGGGGTLTVDVDGDYGDPTEYAEVSAEGILLGNVGRVGTDCSTGHATFDLPAAVLAALAADGFVDVQLRNSFDVDLFCGLNRHHVKLGFGRPVDPVDFGSLFVGLCAERVLTVANTGTDVLVVHELSVNGADFSVTPPSLTLPPGATADVTVRFCPQSVQTLQGTLTLASNDPDQPTLTMALRGEGLAPPDIDVSPTAIHDDLFTGQSRTHTLTVRNLGGSPLTVDLGLESADANVPAPVVASSAPPVAVAVRSAPSFATTAAGASLDEPGPVRSDQRPEGLHAQALPEVVMAGAQVLIVQDFLPWGTMANETILTGRGIAYDVRSSAQLAAIDLSPYRLVIIPSDQSTSYYVTVNAQTAKLDAFVRGGGVLEVHAAGWGWNSGDASQFTIPGGMRIESYYSSQNTILAPAHPIVAGVPSPFTGSSASHAHFRDIPVGADLLVEDQFPAPDLVVYRLGLGTVVAAGQTLEFGYANGQPAGIILQNMLAFSYQPTPPWFTVSPHHATVPPGGTATIAVTLDATGLLGGDYAANLRIASNDPDEDTLRVPVSLHVTGVPDLKLAGEPRSVQSTKTYTTSGAATTHALAVSTDVSGGAEIELEVNGDYGDFVEVATVYVEGVRLGEFGRLGTDCTSGRATFPISAAVFAAVVADGVAQVVVQNSADVDVFCSENRHTVTLRYSAAPDPLAFGDVFLGNCGTRTLQVSNAGTDELVVSDVQGSRSEFTASPTSFTLAPGASQDVVVSFCPAVAGEVTGTLAIASNDPDGDVTVNLQGTGLVPPDIALARTSVTEDLMVGQQSVRDFAVANVGGSDLALKMSLRLVTPTPSLGAASVTGGGARAPVPDDFSSMRGRYVPLAAATPPVTETVTSTAPGATAPAHAAAPLLLAGGGPGATVVPIFQDGFETGSPGWTHQAAGPDGLDQWALSTARASGGLRSWHASQHAGAGAEVLVSPAISLAGYSDATLTFRHWYNFDDCSGDPTFEPDGGIVEVRVVGTPTWQQVFPAGGYPYVLDIVCSNPLETLPAYSHDGQVGATFGTATFDLTPYIGQSIQFRFHAGWDCGNCENNEGWYVDDVLVSSSGPAWLSLSPTQATIPAGGVKHFDLRFDSNQLGPGVYDAELVAASNDPDEPSLTVPVRLRVANVMANVDVDPNTLNLGSQGNFVTAYLELPAGHDVNSIVVPGVTLNDVTPAPHVPTIGDQDLDGVPDLMLKFARDQVSQTLEEGDDVRMVVAGELAGGDRFLAIDRVRVMRHHVTAPTAGQLVPAGANQAVRWSVPPGWKPDHADLDYTLDGGVTWTSIAGGVQGSSYTWSVPELDTRQVRVRVSLFDGHGLMAYAVNAGEFQIRPAVTDMGGGVLPSSMRLLPNAPNPFQSGHATAMAYELPTTSAVNLAVYSVSGQLVRVLVDGTLPAGRHQALWDGRDRDGRPVGAGIYFVQMRAGSFRAARRITLLN